MQRDRRANSSAGRMMTVAIALGIGFLAGLAGRRDNAA